MCKLTPSQSTDIGVDLYSVVFNVSLFLPPQLNRVMIFTNAEYGYTTNVVTVVATTA